MSQKRPLLNCENLGCFSNLHVVCALFYELDEIASVSTITRKKLIIRFTLVSIDFYWTFFMPIYENWILKMRKPGLKNGKIFPMTTSLLSPSGGINTCTRGRPPRAWGWSLLSLLAVSRWFRFPLSLVLVGLRMRWFRLSESLVFLVVAMVSLVPRLVLPDPVEIWSKVGISRRKLVAFRVYQP